jgi:hypothetical protein
VSISSDEASLVSSVHPGEMQGTTDQTAIEELLSAPPHSAVLDLHHEGIQASPHPNSRFTHLHDKELIPQPRLASLGPNFPAVRKSGAELLDLDGVLPDIGKKIGDPINIFPSFEVVVDHGTFTLEFLGIKYDNERKLLFKCRTGLGSPEFPTPRGTFYLTRIFDDKPLWIPPPKDWAYGMVQSRAVYGGHMIPLFSKKAMSEPGDELGFEDNMGPKMKLVDNGFYRIHGTDSPWTIGSGQSHGCVRLLNKSVKQLADLMKMYVGTMDRGQTENGVYINLAKPVKMVLK